MKFSNISIISKKQYIPPSIYVEEIDVGDIIAATGGDVDGKDIDKTPGVGNDNLDETEDVEEEGGAKRYWKASYFEEFESGF